ncbi:MAG: hypothetical protein HN359_00065 [Actinobacteria bacterium]|jgi:ABC-type dipeptide/oligopeptide/nickel transport system permease component|nr:hypothetical protein [Actinomycetota bacterium]MBT4342961.1 hypothetical protein [Actinomycetota bacterium]MBT4785555.1 hypothetical protein [Actinomycetota bacterium]MBT6064010.1 hypothetical protein [Actinomycetota bacterium]MBT7662151.1 hypothetical protein [Actinomycetota bacterium]
MIPVMLMVGLVAGAFVRERVTWRWIALVGLAVSLIFGFIVGRMNLTEGFLNTLLTGFAATGLSMANFVVGALVSVLLRWVATMLLRQSA